MGPYAFEYWTTGLGPSGLRVLDGWLYILD